MKAATASVAALALMSPVAAKAQSGAVEIAVPDLLLEYGNPYLSYYSAAPAVFFMPAIFDSLTSIGPNGETTPVLAVSWKNIDPTTWQFTLRRNVKFSNGKPVTAHSIADNINDIYLSDYTKEKRIRRDIPNPAGARVIDDYTVEITTKRPNPIFVKEIGGLAIPEPGAWKDMGPVEYTKRPVASGPYKLASENPDWATGSIDLVPFDGSWHPGRVAALKITAIPERQARLSALLSKQVDIALGLNMDAYDAITEAGDTFYTAAAPQISTIALVATRNSSPFKDKRVRQAVNFAVDKVGMNEHLLRGRASPASQPATPSTVGYNPNVKPYPYDPDKAKQLLAEAGYPNGFNVTMEAIISGSTTADAEIYQQVVIDLGRVGVNVDLIPVRIADWSKKFNTPDEEGNVQFPNMFGIGYFLTPELDATRSYIIHWCDKKPAWFCNESLRPLVTTARSDFDEGKRVAALNRLMVESHEDAPVLFLVNQIDVVGVSKDVKDFEMVHRFMNFDTFTKAR